MFLDLQAQPAPAEDSFKDCQSLKATNSVMNWITLQINIYVFKYIIFVECDFKVLWLRTCKASLPKYIPKRKQDNGKNNIVISEGGTQAFQSNSAVNGLVQNSCIWKAKPQHLKANALLFNRQWWASWIKNKSKQNKKPSATRKCYQRYLNPVGEIFKGKLCLFCQAYILIALGCSSASSKIQGISGTRISFISAWPLCFLESQTLFTCLAALSCRTI